ncbi:MAG: hypothetical protein ACUVUC_13545 [Thermoguttaceae bacterium]
MKKVAEETWKNTLLLDLVNSNPGRARSGSWADTGHKHFENWFAMDRAFAGWLERLRGAKLQVLGEEYVVVARRVLEPRVLYTVHNFHKGQQKDGGSSQRAKALSGKEIGSAPPVL